MTSRRKFHLFNCDRVYKLDPIEDLLFTTKEKLGFEMSVEKHYFSLSEISEFSDQTIPTLEMDAAILAVHAGESRLSINEDTQHGYAKVYRALLQATGGNVIIVIGGDDNYKNEKEEEKAVISRWARRRVGSQVKEEFLDGRNSFIFSWDKKHRAIHEEALIHYFDPSKKGQKFEYQLPKRNVTPDPLAAQTVLTPDHGHTLLDNEAEQSSVKKDTAIEEKLQVEAIRPNPLAATVAADYGRTLSGNKPEHPSMHKDTAVEEKRQVEDLAVLGCDVSAETMNVVENVIEDLRRRINLSGNPPVKNYSPVDIKSYLMKNPLSFCVLVVDAEAFYYAYRYSTERKVELEEIIRKAADVVVEKVVFTICGRCPLPSSEEETFAQNIECILKEKRKGLVVWLEDGKLNVEPDVLIQLMLQTATMAEDTEAQKSHFGELSGPTSVASGSMADTSPAQQTEKHMASLPQQEPRYDPKPYLGEEYHTERPDVHPPVATNNERGGMEPMEVLMLKTRIRYGEISLSPGDLEHCYPDWTVPQHIVESLKRGYSTTASGVLSIFSNEKGDLKSFVRADRMATCLLI